MCGVKVVLGVMLRYPWPLFPIDLEIEIKGSAVSFEIGDCFVFRWRFGFGFDQFSILLFYVFNFQFFQFFSDGAKDRSVWLGSVHDISYLRGLCSLSCPRHCQPWDNWILYQSKSATFLLSLTNITK